jgi:CrcB protein
MFLQGLVICVAACIGALLRWSVQLWLNPGGTLPWGTLTVNLVGGFLIGVCIAAFDAFPEIDPAWRLMAITGFLGTLTTFSSFSAEVVGMLLQGRAGLALGTVALHLGGSLCLTWLGFRAAQSVLA